MYALVGVALSLTLLPSAGASTTPFTSIGLIRAGNTDVVYLMAWTGCKAPTCLALYRTNVEGTKLTKVSLPPGASVSTFGRVVFATPNDGYATEGGYFPSTLYATTNGGHTWRKVMSGHDVTYVVTTTSSEVMVTSVRCTPRTDDCGQYSVRRSSLAATHWVTLPVLWKTGNAHGEQLYGPSLAAYGSDVWELETESTNGGGASLWTSHNFGRTFTRARETFPQLVSVTGCSLDPMSSSSLWAQCPTGMQVSFWHSSDGGVRWSPISQSQYFGTGGGAFDPVTSTVAYLDYGGVVKADNFVRLSDGGRVARTVGELRCTDASIVFTSVARGLMSCGENYTTASLRVTSNGGATWSVVTLPRG